VSDGESNSHNSGFETRAGSSPRSQSATCPRSYVPHSLVSFFTPGKAFRTRPGLWSRRDLRARSQGPKGTRWQRQTKSRFRRWPDADHSPFSKTWIHKFVRLETSNMSHSYFSLVSCTLDSTRKEYVPLNLDRIQHWIDQGRLSSSPDKPITARELLLSKCVHDVKAGIKLLASVRLNRPSKYCLALISGSFRVHNSSRHLSSSNPRKHPRRQSQPLNKTAGR